MTRRGAAKKYDFTPQLDEALRRIYAEHGGRHKVMAPAIQGLMRRTGCAGQDCDGHPVQETNGKSAGSYSA